MIWETREKETAKDEDAYKFAEKNEEIGRNKVPISPSKGKLRIPTR